MSNSKLRGKVVVNRSNSEYGVVNEILNGTNGYNDDYRSSKFSSSSVQRNRSQRRDRRIGNDVNDQRFNKQVSFTCSTNNNNSKSSGLYQQSSSGASIAQSIETDINKTNTSLVGGLSTAPLPSALVAPQVSYGRRNMGPRGRGRGGNVPRGLNRSRSQTGVDNVVPPISAVSIAGNNSLPVNVPTSSTSTLHSDEYPADLYYYESFTASTAPVAATSVVDVNVPLNGAGTFGPPPFYFNTHYIPYESLKELLRKQIEYYFSEENLQRDFFLRRKMDEQGFLPVSLIASFHRVQGLTQDVSLVVDALSDSTTVEIVDGVRLRTRVDPEKWPLVSPFRLFHGDRTNKA